MKIGITQLSVVIATLEVIEVKGVKAFKFLKLSLRSK